VWRICPVVIINVRPSWGRHDKVVIFVGDFENDLDHFHVFPWNAACQAFPHDNCQGKYVHT